MFYKGDSAVLKNIILLMTITGSLLFMIYLLITWCAGKTMKTELRFLWLKTILFLYLVPFQLFKYLFPEWLWRKKWSEIAIYPITENYIIYSQNDYIADASVVFTWIWCVASGTIAVIFTAFHLIRYLHMKRVMKTSTVKIGSGWQTKKLEDVKREIGLKRDVKFVFSEYFDSPFTFGYISPIVVLPACMKEAGEEEWDFVVRHELNHIKCKHTTVKFLALITNFIHFFNPIAYLLRHEICSMCEIDCDSKTIKGYNAERRRKYEEYIVDTATCFDGLSAVGSIGLLGNKSGKNNIQRRIMEINQFKKKRSLVSAMTMLVAVLIGSVSVYAYEPAVELDWEDEVLPNTTFSVCSKESDVLKINPNTGDIFTDKSGNTYDTSGVDRAICFHNYTNVVLLEHTLNADGSCVTLYYDAKRCTKCGYIKEKVDNGGKTTFKKCPH